MIDIAGHDRITKLAVVDETPQNTDREIAKDLVREMLEIGELQADVVDPLIKEALFKLARNRGDLLGSVKIVIQITQDPREGGDDQIIVSSERKDVALKQYFDEADIKATLAIQRRMVSRDLCGND